MINDMNTEQKKRLLVDRLENAERELTSVVISALSFCGHTRDNLPLELGRCIKMIQEMCDEVENKE